jgi:hypothetical protein
MLPEWLQPLTSNFRSIRTQRRGGLPRQAGGGACHYHYNDLRALREIVTPLGSQRRWAATGWSGDVPAILTTEGVTGFDWWRFRDRI